MLDLKFIRDHLEAVWVNCRNRNVAVDLDGFVALDANRRKLLGEVEALRQQQNENAQAMKGKLEPAAREALIARGRGLKDRETELDAALAKTAEELDALVRPLPHMTHPAAP